MGDGGRGGVGIGDRHNIGRAGAAVGRGGHVGVGGGVGGAEVVADRGGAGGDRAGGDRCAVGGARAAHRGAGEGARAERVVEGRGTQPRGVGDGRADGERGAVDERRDRRVGDGGGGHIGVDDRDDVGCSGATDGYGAAVRGAVCRGDVVADRGGAVGDQAGRDRSAVGGARAAHGGAREGACAERVVEGRTAHARVVGDGGADGERRAVGERGDGCVGDGRRDRVGVGDGDGLRRGGAGRGYGGGVAGAVGGPDVVADAGGAVGDGACGDGGRKVGAGRGRHRGGLEGAGVDGPEEGHAAHARGVGDRSGQGDGVSVDRGSGRRVADGRRRRIGRDDGEGIGGSGGRIRRGREVGVGRAVGGGDVVLDARDCDGAGRDVGGVLAAREGHAGGGEAGRAKRAVEEGGTGNARRIGDGRSDGDRVARELTVGDAGMGDGGSRRVARAHGEGVGGGGRGGGERRSVGPGIGGADVVLDAGGGDAEAGDGARVGGARRERHRDAAVEGVAGGPVEELYGGDARGVGHIGGHCHIR